MVYLINEVEENFFTLDSISNQWATLLNQRSMFTAVWYPIPDRGKETSFNKILGIYVIA